MNGEDLTRSPDTQRANRLPPGQRLTTKWPVLQHGAVHSLDADTWTLTIWGLVNAARTITFDEFLALPQVRVLSDIHCVTGWSRLDNVWEGVSTKALQDLVTIDDRARFVIIHGAGGFSTNLRLGDFFQDDALLAVGHDNEPLSPEHGYPVRLVVPRLYFWKSAKWVQGIEFIAEDRPGFWESYGYHNRGDPWKGERFASRPSPA
jgi:DMSO/TMAO reductase YedYZ molybdopterin-dependent catalytic subunit